MPAPNSKETCMPNRRRLWPLPTLSALVCAALLAACGGGDSGPETTRVVSFGDSLSDLGAYSPATSINGPGTGAPYFGGRFTTNTFTGYTATNNTANASLWIEWVAARFGVAITPHEAGFGTQSVKCPAAATPALAGTCTGYGQGGSRVTDPNGIGKSIGFLTVPMTTQMDNHMTRFGGYTGGDLVFVFGGNNDVLLLIGALLQGGITPDAAVLSAQATAGQLATLVKDKIVANGAKRVVVLTTVDFAKTARFVSATPDQKALLTALTTAFNTALTSGLDGVAGVRIIDSNAILSAFIASPASYGLTNVTVAACDPAKIQAITGGAVTGGDSLFCNASAGVPFNGMKTDASASTWLFADGVHPTTGGHKLVADQVILKLKDFGWMPVAQP
jgi:outer membrane lipase/esterase